jgi:hypothetical protein
MKGILNCDPEMPATRQGLNIGLCYGGRHNDPVKRRRLLFSRLRNLTHPSFSRVALLYSRLPLPLQQMSCALKPFHYAA